VISETSVFSSVTGGVLEGPFAGVVLKMGSDSEVD